jgi:hypothetical protein
MFGVLPVDAAPLSLSRQSPSISSSSLSLSPHRDLHSSRLGGLDEEDSAHPEDEKSEALDQDLIRHEEKAVTLEGKVVIFYLRSMNCLCQQIYTETELREYVRRSGFLASLFEGLYLRNKNDVYDLSHCNVDNFNVVMKYIRTGIMPRFTSESDIDDIRTISNYMAVPDEFTNRTLLNTEDLFYSNLTDEETTIVNEEKKVRKMLYENEDTDFRTDDIKYLVSTILDVNTELAHQEWVKELQPPYGRESRGRSHPSPLIYQATIYPMIRVEHDRKGSTLVRDSDRLERFHDRTRNIFRQFDFTDLTIAGGCITSTLVRYRHHDHYHGDVDFFLITKDVNRAMSAVRRLLTHLKTSYPNSIIIKGEYAITIGCGAIQQQSVPITVQIILRLYNSIAQVISGFDIDSCCAAYNGQNFYCMPRFARAVLKGYNLADPERQSRNYGYRLKKYMKRGFNVAIPGYDPSRVCYSQLKNNSVTGLARVLLQIHRSTDVYNRKDLIDTDDYFPNSLDSSASVLRHLKDIAYMHLKCESPEEYTTNYFGIDYGNPPEPEDNDGEGIGLGNAAEPDLEEDNFVGDPADLFHFNGNVNTVVPGHDPFTEAHRKVKRYLMRKNVQLSFKASYSIEEILTGDVYENRPAHETIGLESRLPIEIVFKTRNPGTQLTNSFQPTFESWYHDLYVARLDPYLPI